MSQFQCTLWYDNFFGNVSHSETELPLIDIEQGVIRWYMVAVNLGFTCVSFKKIAIIRQITKLFYNFALSDDHRALLRVYF